MSKNYSLEDGIAVVDGFLPSQERTPLSSGSAIDTAKRFIESGVDLAVIANVDLEDDPRLFVRAFDGTIAAHEAAAEEFGVEPNFATDAQIAGRLPGAFRINKNVALRTVISAALGESLEGPVRAITPTDERLERAKAVLATEQGRERALGIITRIAAELRREAPSTRPLDKDYRGAQLRIPSERFPVHEGGRPNKFVQREQLMEHIRQRLGGLAAADADARVVIETMLVDELDGESLRLG